MPFTNLKATLGQRFNLEGIILAAGILAGDRNLLLPHIAVPDLRWIDWPELRRRGFKGVVFDKDNTITLPYQLALWGPLISEIENCKCVFGDENVVVLSNSAGLYEFDPDGAKASEVERKIGIKVVRHRVKKPAGTTAEIEKQLGCVAVELVVVGDRRFTDVVYGNRNGCLTVLTEPFTSDGEPFVVRQIRRVEEILVERWYKQGLRPLRHNMLGDEDPQMIFVKDFPPSQ